MPVFGFRPGRWFLSRRSKLPIGPIRWIGILVIVAGGILLVSGVVTWIVVQTQLADENITVSDDGARFEGEEVDGPLTA